MLRTNIIFVQELQVQTPFVNWTNSLCSSEDKLPRGERRDTMYCPQERIKIFIIDAAHCPVERLNTHFETDNWYSCMLQKKSRQLPQLAALFLTAGTDEDILPTSEPTFVIPQVCDYISAHGLRKTDYLNRKIYDHEINGILLKMKQRLCSIWCLLDRASLI